MPSEPINWMRIVGSRIPDTWGPSSMPIRVMDATTGTPMKSDKYGETTAIAMIKAKMPAGSFIEFI